MEVKWALEAGQLSDAHAHAAAAPVASAARHFFESIVPLDGVVTDTSCALRRVGGAGAGAGFDPSLLDQPLAPLGLAALVAPLAPLPPPSGELPFDLGAYAKDAVAKDMLRRLSADVAGCVYFLAYSQIAQLNSVCCSMIMALLISCSFLFCSFLCTEVRAIIIIAISRLPDYLPRFAAMKAHEARLGLACLGTPGQWAGLDALEASLIALAKSDADSASAALAGAVDEANSLPASADPPLLRFRLRRAARQYAPIDPNLLTRALMSASAHDDLR